MVSLEDEPPLSRGQALQMILQLPGQGRAIEIAAKVRWVSEMLPNTMGIEFEHGLPEDAVGVLQAIAAA